MKYEDSEYIPDPYYKHAMPVVSDDEIQHLDDLHEKENHNGRDIYEIDQAVIYINIILAYLYAVRIVNNLRRVSSPKNGLRSIDIKPSLD